MFNYVNRNTFFFNLAIWGIKMVTFENFLSKPCSHPPPLKKTDNKPAYANAKQVKFMQQ